MRVPTLMPVEWMEKIIKWKELCPGNTYIFSANTFKKTKELLLDSLRNVEWGGDPKWETRGLRRGSLTAMAMAGVDYEDLKLFSLHTNDPMVTRYLKGGLHAKERHDRARAAAQHLIPPTSTDAPAKQ